MNRLLRYIVSIILIIFLSKLHVNSQNRAEIPTFGIKAGLLMSSVSGDDAIDKYAKRFGPQIGLTGSYYFNPRIALRVELNYEMKGGKFDNHEMTMDLHYGTLPLYVRYGFSQDPEIYIYGGGYGSYLISAKTKGTYKIRINDDNINETINEDITKNLNKFDAGIIIGAGAQGRFNRWLDIFLDFRFSYGFLNIDNNSSDLRYNFNYTEFWPEQNVDKPKNKAYMLTTGFIFFFDPR